MTGEPLGYGSLREGPLATARRGFGGVILIALLLAGVAGGLILHARLTGRPLWTVRHVEVEGNRSLGMVELLQRLRLGPGTPWWRVSPGAVRRLRAEEPRLAEVTVSWRWPRDLVVRVRERESFLRVWGDPPLEVARDGVLLETREDLDPADLPLLTGLPSTSLAPNRRLELAEAGEAWREFLSLCESEPELWREISEIHYDGGRDFQVFLRRGRRVILWEAGINADLKKTIPVLLSDIERLGQDDVVLDLRFRKQVVVRLPAAAGDSAAAPASSSGRQRRAAGRGEERSGGRRA